MGIECEIVALLDDWQVLESTVDFSVLLGQFWPHDWPLEGVVMTFFIRTISVFVTQLSIWFSCLQCSCFRSHPDGMSIKPGNVKLMAVLIQAAYLTYTDAIRL